MEGFSTRKGVLADSKFPTCRRVGLFTIVIVLPGTGRSPFFVLECVFFCGPQTLYRDTLFAYDLPLADQGCGSVAY
jgi:hypothetical protein